MFDLKRLRLQCSDWSGNCSTKGQLLEKKLSEEKLFFFLAVKNGGAGVKIQWAQEITGNSTGDGLRRLSRHEHENALVIIFHKIDSWFAICPCEFERRARHAAKNQPSWFQILPIIWINCLMYPFLYYIWLYFSDEIL